MPENCSDKRTVALRRNAPTRPDWDSEHLGVWMDEDGPVPALNVTWTIKVDCKQC